MEKKDEFFIYSLTWKTWNAMGRPKKRKGGPKSRIFSHYDRKKSKSSYSLRWRDWAKERHAITSSFLMPAGKNCPGNDQTKDYKLRS